MPTEEEAHRLGSRLSQLLADTILGLSPHHSTMSETVREEFRARFLDGLEEHTATLVGPLLASVADEAEVPPQLVGLLAELGVPTEQFTGIISQFFIFGVMFTLAQAMLAPFVQQVQNDVWGAHPDRPLSPADIGTAVVRGFSLGDSGGTTVPQWAFDEAAKSGMGPDVVSTMVGVTGMAPALQLLFEMVRRQIIPEGTLDGGGETLISGIQQSDVRDPWIPYVTKLRYVQPSPIDMVRAAVQDQWDDVVGSGPIYDLAKQWATTLGLEPADYLNSNPSWFDLLYNVAGRPPGPQEMARAANRGLTDWDSRGSASVSFSQAISESDIKDKYIALLKALAVYWPPSGEVRTLLLHGGIDETQALAYWKANGVPDALAQGYLHLARIEQVTQDKALAKGDILTLVQEQAIGDADALTLLEQIGYTGTNADLLLQMAHFRFELDGLRAVVRRVASLYTGRKITATQAQDALVGVGLPQTQIDALVTTWTHQRDSEVLVPTPAQVTSAAYYQVITPDVALGMLEGMGYDPWSAWLVLSDRLHSALPNPPPKPTGGVFGP